MEEEEDEEGLFYLSLHATVPASKVGSRSASEHRTSKRSIVLHICHIIIHICHIIIASTGLARGR